MDNGLGKNDPYRGMRTGKDDTRPEFLEGLNSEGNSKKSKLSDGGKKQNARSDNESKNRVGRDDLKAAENSAEEGGFYRPKETVAEGGKKIGGLFSGGGKTKAGKKKSKFNLKSTAGIAIFGIIILVAAVVIVGVPVYMIGTIDYNLQKALGFTDTVAVLEKQGEYVTAEMLASGEVPNGYAEDLAKKGLEVGQVTLAGNFVRTNVYLDNIEELDEVASRGGYFANAGDGELAILFNGELIKASEFVMAVESSPEMYEAYSEALDISARYYYSSEVGKVYSDMGLSRNDFGDWESTGDSEKDTESYYEILEKILDEDSKVTVSGVDAVEEDGKGILTGFTENISSGDAGQIVNNVASQTTAGDTGTATKRAAQLLNSAISSSEPYKAVRAFMAIEEPIQRARAGDNGPVNEVMNSLNEKTKMVYTDVNTGETVTQEKSILETENFVAAVSGGTFSKAEANNFSRDGVLVATNSADVDSIEKTTVSSNGRKQSDATITISGSNVADNSAFNKSISSIDMAVSKKNSELFHSVVGGNRIVAGGSFLSNKINLTVLGAMPSDSDSVKEYSRVVNEVLARKAEAERATLSPFDISSPNTFLGSIVHNFAMTLLRKPSTSVNESPVVSVASTIADLAGKSMKDLTNEVTAEGDDVSYMTLAGDCATVGTVGVIGDIYCTSHNTVDTSMMYRKKSDWGDMKNNPGYKDYVSYGMTREVTVGVKSAEVCKAYKKNSSISTIYDALDTVSSAFGAYGECLGIGVFGGSNAMAIATGAKFTLSSEKNDNVGNVREYTAYTLYDTVYSLLSEKKTAAAEIMEEYYAKNPRDDSAAGIIARRSGMSKEEAQIALNYASYLNMIAKYDASTRWVFGGFKINTKKDFLIEQDEEIKGNLYAVWSKRAEYRDERNRNFTV